jgi:hypothetical protein
MSMLHSDDQFDCLSTFSKTRDASRDAMMSQSHTVLCMTCTEMMFIVTRGETVR